MLADSISEEKKEFAETLPFGVVILNADKRIVWLNRLACSQLYCSREQVLATSWNASFPTILTDEIAAEAFGGSEALQFKFGDHHFIAQITRYEGAEGGLLIVFQEMDRFEHLIKEMDSYKNLDVDLKAIFDISYDVIYVSDGQGITLRVSSASERLWGYKESELVGKSVYQLEKEGVYSPSITRLVLEKKEKISMTQTTKTGRRLMVVGVPIMDENGQIIRVVNASRDITEVSRLKNELTAMKQLSEGYRQELMNLRIKNDIDNRLIYRSEKMKRVIVLAEKISKVDSTVLLFGESGVGKELIASLIHKWSERENGPFISVNCGGIPESVLESELFGSSEGTMSGHSGSFVTANGGTLFLDDIDQLPQSLQVKVYRAMQERKVSHASGTVPLNLRVIASTGADLEDRVRKGLFRKDLYYLLNVVPMAIPPLRERREDVIPLILHFADRINKKYGISKKFNPRLLKTLQDYEWPGNARELQNIVERLLVTVDSEWIEIEHLPEYMDPSRSGQKLIQINRIVPLKEAIESLEKELLTLAQERYGSTTKMAEALGVNQSTVSRKLQQYGK